MCPCHDATEYDLREAWRTGHRHPETVKRLTAAFMGPCQGKYCAPLVRELLDELGADEQRRPTARPPVFPVRLGALADPEPGSDP